MHGKWEYITSDAKLSSARQALVHWFIPENYQGKTWGPLPFRTRDGNIIFPVSGGSGFCYLDEFLQATNLGAQFVEAWILHKTCNCKPFYRIPGVYNERCKIGKEGPGIVLKLGPNASYGKLAQTVGSRAYTSVLWASMVTSGCRAQLIQAMLHYKDLSNLLMVATDGIYGLEEIALPKPDETGTSETGKPLGGWEYKKIGGGIFAAKPGINFPLKDPTISMSRGRGYGRAVVLKNKGQILESWKNFGASNTIHFPLVVRFLGAKSQITRALNPDIGKPYIFKRSKGYGEWVEKPMVMNLTPLPKRAGVFGNILIPHRIKGDFLSAPYSKLIDAPNVMAHWEEMLEEQPC
jgi:hypothetical protein